MIVVKIRKNRYLIFRIICKDGRSIGFSDVLNAIFSSLSSLFGEVGSSKISFSLMKYCPELGIGILRCDHLSVSKVRAALALIRSVSGDDVIFSVIKISGTFKKAEKILNNLSKQLITGV
ncbi:MAG: hypothetical protein HA488_00450 [Candidatus Verstraetearchaeota archaeon]|jgi:RNase P/RNase MRP subunit POP5|nr:Rpp14/Pop5 family protein [Candidatus Culexarchaeum yellowstonense]MCS7367165.1 Rpp14/Pop5 family protein [Candidatus Culexarchaeum yellowstonense]NHV11695.1 hypothetical protein [Candidatus Verstraetearchaeota archaeon]